MKVYISVDIEGTAGITNWDEAEKSHADHPAHRAQMTREALAACDGAIAAGAREIFIKDAHDTGRNILQEDLPECARLIRDWSGHPFMMVQALDETFDAALFVGYHSKAGAEGNPLAHTLSGRVMRMRLNGGPISEFTLAAYTAATVGVPVVFVSGDHQLCEDVESCNPNIVTVAISEGKGPSSISISPNTACARIRAGARRALTGDLKKSLVTLPGAFTLEIEYDNPVDAYKASWFPGCKHIGNCAIRFETHDFFEVMRTLQFVT